MLSVRKTDRSELKRSDDNLVDDILNKTRSGHVPFAIDIDDEDDDIDEIEQDVSIFPKGQQPKSPLLQARREPPKKIVIGSPIKNTFKHVAGAGLKRSDTSKVVSEFRAQDTKLNRSSTLSINSSTASIKTKVSYSTPKGTSKDTTSKSNRLLEWFKRSFGGKWKSKVTKKSSQQSKKEEYLKIINEFKSIKKSSSLSDDDNDQD